MRHTQAVTKAYFIEILVRLCKGVCRKRHELWLISWCLHYDSTPFQCMLFIKQFMAKKNAGQEHPHYSPVLVLSYVHLFTMEGQRL